MFVFCIISFEAFSFVPLPFSEEQNTPADEKAYIIGKLLSSKINMNTVYILYFNDVSLRFIFIFYILL